MIKLYNHQKKIITEDKKRCGIFQGCGSGKTLTALHLATGDTLVICPKTVRDDRIWQKNLEVIGKELNLTVISKEDFRSDKFVQKRYDTIIIDEAHLVAGATPSIKYVKRQPVPKCSKLFDKLVKYLQEYAPDRLYLLTATPVRSPMCVWAIARLLGKNWNFYQFRDYFYIQVKRGYKEFFITKNDQGSKAMIGKCVRSLGYTGKLDDYFDVPEQIYRVINVELTKEQQEKIKDIQIEYPDPIVLTGKTHQVENGVLAGDEYAKPEYFKDNKLEILKDLALEFPKMVIFAKYTMQVEKIQKTLQDDGYYVLTLQGSTKDRQQVLKDAHNRDNCIIVIQSQISAGYELPNFPVMVFASLDYSVVNRVQSEGRILRANALKHNLYIDIVAKGNVDKAVHNSIINKVDFSESIYAETRS